MILESFENRYKLGICKDNYYFLSDHHIYYTDTSIVHLGTGKNPEMRSKGNAMSLK